MSQRHLIENYNTASNGEVHAQGVVAESISSQIDPSQLNVLMPKQGLTVPQGGFIVPEGPTGGPLQGSSMSGAIPESVQPPDPPPPIDPTLQPVLNSINPSSARIGSPDLTMHVNGSKFVDGSVIVFNNGDETTTFINEGQLSTIIKPSTATTPGDFPVSVRNPDGQLTDTVKTFTFIQERNLPIGPLTITLIEDHADGIALTLADGIAEVGDTVLVEATGNTSINGTYSVLSVDGQTIVVDNNYELLTPLENKGRLTVTA